LFSLKSNPHIRELVEWVVKKEVELTSLGPIGGDELTIRRQQVRVGLSLILY
jgi:hypothetical protein